MRMPLPIAGLLFAATVLPLAAGTLSSAGPPSFTIMIPNGWTNNPSGSAIADVRDPSGQRGFLFAAQPYNVDIMNYQNEQALMAGVVRAGGYPVSNANKSPTTFYFDSKLRIKNTVYNACYYYVEDKGYLYCLTIISSTGKPEDDSDLEKVVHSFGTSSQ